MKAINFLKFDTSPPTLKLPPQGEVVAYFDPVTEKIIAKDHTGAEVIFGGGATPDTSGGAAAAGEIGETRQAFLPIGLTPLTLVADEPANVVSIELTPGDWDVEGVASFGSASATPGICLASISPASETHVSNGQEGYATVTGDNFASAPLTRRIIRVSVTTTYYLVVTAAFTSGAMEAGGGITARRPR